MCCPTSRDAIRFRLAAREYEVRANAVGYKSDPRVGMKLNAGESSSLDFALEKGMVRWSDLSVYQGKKLLPKGRANS